MRQSYLALFFLVIAAAAPGLTGCATVRTMPALASYGSPKVYSGARLDLNAARDDKAGLDKFKVDAPVHPVIDLPFSAILDTIILPVTVPVAMYEFVFGK